MKTNEIDDKRALDWIAQILRKDDIDGEDWEMIMRVIEWTGRDISPIDEDEDNDHND